ncbi:MAG: glutathione S-transferase/maleylpyruvate isomerase [Yoonia sp.]|jgi:glutathione S-transferase/maleylpyruvate isomerase
MGFERKLSDQTTLTNGANRTRLAFFIFIKGVRPMLTIYSVPVAVYCAKLRIMLRHKSISFEQLPPPGGYGSDEYRAIVPSGNLPAMIHDGFMLSDSEAIAEYLDEAFPDVPMLPDTIKLRAKTREFSRSHDTRLEPAVRAIYPQVAFATRDAAAVKAGGALISKHLSSLGLLLSANPLNTDQLWLCDCGFAVTFAWIKAFEAALGLPVDWPQTVRDYDTRLQGFQVVTGELADYRPAMDAYLEKANPPQA